MGEFLAQKGAQKDGGASHLTHTALKIVALTLVLVRHGDESRVLLLEGGASRCTVHEGEGCMKLRVEVSAQHRC